jgi:hypothetical protein
MVWAIFHTMKNPYRGPGHRWPLVSRGPPPQLLAWVLLPRQPTHIVSNRKENDLVSQSANDHEYDYVQENGM